eukprot:TRINITY_DN36879_c0_g1_i1.p1 TRINITY_DN36879_c0_g1~~TRINITY_DN36879_c0_g1_i1.p1  ORF type:complete len:367 (+),score=63.09 TRINITY_DN36879_c0_g1_i1:73-1101(+)
MAAAVPVLHARSADVGRPGADCEGGAQGCDEGGEVVELNVGGQLFASTRSTLTTGPAADTMLSAMISGPVPAVRDREGRLFIDRDPEPFRLILSCLRGRMSAPRLPPGECLRAAEEADYYGFHEYANMFRGAALPRCERLFGEQQRSVQLKSVSLNDGWVRYCRMDLDAGAAPAPALSCVAVGLHLSGVPEGSAVPSQPTAVLRAALYVESAPAMGGRRETVMVSETAAHVLALDTAGHIELPLLRPVSLQRVRAVWVGAVASCKMSVLCYEYSQGDYTRCTRGALSDPFPHSLPASETPVTSRNGIFHLVAEDSTTVPGCPSCAAALRPPPRGHLCRAGCP